MVDFRFSQSQTRKIGPGLRVSAPEKWQREKPAQFEPAWFQWKPSQLKSKNSYHRYKATNKKMRPREKAAIIMLRRDHGYTYGQIANFLERSTRQIYDVWQGFCDLCMKIGAPLRRLDWRVGKKPLAEKMRQSSNRAGLLGGVYGAGWNSFIDAEEGEPP